MYTGLTAAIKILDYIDGEPVLKSIGYISGFSIDDTSDTITVSRVGKNYNEAIAGKQSWSASADGVISFEGNLGQQALFAAKHKRQKLVLHFYLADRVNSCGSETYLSGTGVIESLSLGVSAESVSTISVSIKGCGALDVFHCGEELKTGDTLEEVFFHLMLNQNGELEAVVDEDNAYRLSKGENDELKVLLGGYRRIKNKQGDIKNGREV